MFCVCWEETLTRWSVIIGCGHSRGKQCLKADISAGPMLVQRIIRWPSIGPALAQRHVCGGECQILTWEINEDGMILVGRNLSGQAVCRIPCSLPVPTSPRALSRDTPASAALFRHFNFMARIDSSLPAWAIIGEKRREIEPLCESSPSLSVFLSPPLQRWNICV